MKIVFFGSDEFSIKALTACLHNGTEVSLVVTTPAQKKGRGLHVEPSDVFTFCKKNDLPVAEFSTLRDPSVAEKLLSLAPDIFVAASYGKLIPVELLSIPKYRLNVHPSLLPKYRGAAPINWPILNGDDETGVSILDIAERLDSGDIYYQEKLPIGPRMTAEQLTAQLAALSYGVLKKVLEQIKDGKLRGIPQDESQATLARQLEKKDGEISLGMPAGEIDRKVRGLTPWPGAFFFLKNERVRLIETEPISESHPQRLPSGAEPGIPLNTCGNEKSDAPSISPGTILAVEKDGGLILATGQGALKILRLKPEGKKEMSGADFAHGRHLVPGMLL